MQTVACCCVFCIQDATARYSDTAEQRKNQMKGSVKNERKEGRGKQEGNRKERKGKERRGKERKGKETKRKERKGNQLKHVLCMQGAKGGKRKARSEEGAEEGLAAGKAAGQSRKVVKRAQGHTPSRKGGPLVSTLRGQSPAAKGPVPSSSTPLRHLNGPRGVQGGLSRLAHSTHAADVENAAKASNGTPAAQVCFRLTATALNTSPNSPQNVPPQVVSGQSPGWE